MSASSNAFRFLGSGVWKPSVNRPWTDLSKSRASSRRPFSLRRRAKFTATRNSSPRVPCARHRGCAETALDLPSCLPTVSAPANYPSTDGVPHQRILRRSPPLYPMPLREPSARPLSHRSERGLGKHRIERQPRKKREPSPERLLALLHRRRHRRSRPVKRSPGTRLPSKLAATVSGWPEISCRSDLTAIVHFGHRSPERVTTCGFQPSMF
jgi:hypothetical protein